MCVVLKGIENFLFFLETQQWLRSLLKKENYQTVVSKNQKCAEERLLQIEFHETAPESDILGWEEQDQIEYAQCVAIFKKYITVEFSLYAR